MKILRRSIEEVNEHSETITGYCRHLIKDGYDPDWRLEVYRKGRIDDPDVIVKNIGEAAKLMVVESPSPHFVKYRESPTKRKAQETSVRSPLVRLNDYPATLVAPLN